MRATAQSRERCVLLKIDRPLGGQRAGGRVDGSSTSIGALVSLRAMACARSRGRSVGAGCAQRCRHAPRCCCTTRRGSTAALAAHAAVHSWILASQVCVCATCVCATWWHTVVCIKASHKNKASGEKKQKTLPGRLERPTSWWPIPSCPRRAGTKPVVQPSYEPSLTAMRSGHLSYGSFVPMVGGHGDAPVWRARHSLTHEAQNA